MRQAVITALYGTANANITGSPRDMAQVIKMSAQIVVGTGSATGSVQIQVSNDVVIAQSPFANTAFTNWSNLGSAVSITGSGVTLIAQQDMCYRGLRVIYTDGSSGAGTASVAVNLNVLSA